MATGALDANGIWQYGEDDSEPTFSGLLNKLAGSTSDTVTRLEGFTGFTGTVPTTNLPTIPVNKGGTGATTVAAAQDALAVGLTKVVPSSVSVSSGSGSFSQNRISFNGAGTINIENIFSSSHVNYRFVIHIYSASATSALKISLRNAGGINVSSNYYYQGSQVAGSLAIDRYFGLPDTGYVPAKIEGGNRGAGTVDVHYPFISDRTLFTSNSYGSTGGQTATFTTSGLENSSYQATGIALYPTTGTITGSIEIYGYNQG